MSVADIDELEDDDCDTEEVRGRLQRKLMERQKSVLVLVLIKDHLNHQKDAHPKGIRIPGLLSYVRVYKLT